MFDCLQKKQQVSFLDFLLQAIYSSNVLSIFSYLKAEVLAEGNSTLGRSTVLHNQFSAETSFTILNQFHTVRQPYDQTRQKKIPCGYVALIKGASFARKDSFSVPVRGFLTRRKIVLDKQFCQNCIYHIVMTGNQFILYYTLAQLYKTKEYIMGYTYILILKGSDIFT